MGVCFGDVDVFGFGAKVDDGSDVEVVGEEGAVSRGGGVGTSGAVKYVGLKDGGVGEGVDGYADVAEVENIFEFEWRRHIGKCCCDVEGQLGESVGCEGLFGI